MGDGDSGICGGCDRGGDSGDDFKRNLRGMERFALFSASSEDEGVSTFQADDSLILARVIDEERVDFVLGFGVLGGAFADVDLLGIGAMVEQTGVGEGVVDHDVG